MAHNKKTFKPLSPVALQRATGGATVIEYAIVSLIASIALSLR